MALFVRRGLQLFTVGVVVASLALGGSQATPAQARQRGQASITTTVVGSWSSTVVSRGAPVVVRGRVSTPRVRRVVVLQRLTAAGWRNVSRVRTVRGRYALAVPTSAAGTGTYRVRVLSSGRYRGGVTGAVRVTVRQSAPAGNGSAFAFLSREGEPSAAVARWNPCTPIRYRINVTQASAGAVADVQAALARVTATSGLRFTYRGGTTFVPTTTATYPADTDLVLAWVQPGSTDLFPRATSGYDAAGYGGAAWQYLTVGGAPRSQIVKGYALFNARLPLTGGFGAGPVYGWQGTRGQLILHEVGHAVGLAHPHVADTTEIMYPTMTRKPAEYAAGDRAGLRLVGASQGCLSPSVTGAFVPATTGQLTWSTAG
jgi:hypothetical protein